MLVRHFIAQNSLLILFSNSITFEDGNWILKDGDGAKLSTNGTWLIVDELFKIYD